MSSIVLIGMQYGDEGKGCITDYLSNNADIVVRFNGGNNAGHTVVVGDKTYKLHLIPSGILRDNVICVLGNGVVIDPAEMVKELDKLEKEGISIDGRFFISNRAHIILPIHRFRDKKLEENREEKIGTTGRGIGPTFIDKVGRVGIRVGDLTLSQERLKTLIARNFNETDPISLSAITQLVSDYKKIVLPKLKDKIIDTSKLINDHLDSGSNVLFEGAQGTLIDIDHGTYPYVTSSSSCAGGVCAGAGVSPLKINDIIGVVKVYTTRVGEGPFPTEIHDETADMLRKNGKEYGTTTGRPRRCGWLDIPALRYVTMINGFSYIVLTKLDVLTGMDEIPICIGYKINGRSYDTFPSTCEELNKVEPLYVKMPGWKEDISNVRSFDALPYQTQKYISFISGELGVSILLVGVGAERNQTIVMRDLWG